MGLDGVELIMAVEEKFAINISDEEAQNVITVGDLKRLVLAKLNVTDESTCLTQRAFHLIRRNAIAAFGLPRRNLRPDTHLNNVIPRTNRRETWQRFQLSLGVAQLPELVRPGAISTGLTALSVATLVGTAWYATKAELFGFGSSLFIGLIAAAVVGWLSVELTQPLKTEFSEGYEQVRDLARFLVARYPQLLGKTRTTKWTEEEVWCLLRDVIIEQTLVTKFEENSRIVDDLHID